MRREHAKLDELRLSTWNDHADHQRFCNGPTKALVSTGFSQQNLLLKAQHLRFRDRQRVPQGTGGIEECAVQGSANDDGDAERTGNLRGGDVERFRSPRCSSSEVASASSTSLGPAISPSTATDISRASDSRPLDARCSPRHAIQARNRSHRVAPADEGSTKTRKKVNGARRVRDRPRARGREVPSATVGVDGDLLIDGLPALTAAAGQQW
nr:lcrA [Rhizobium sp.]